MANANPTKTTVTHSKRYMNFSIFYERINAANAIAAQTAS